MGHLSDRRLSRGEENAVAIIGLRRAATSRRWVAGQGNEVSVPSVMNAVFDNPKLMAKTIFRSWFKRLGLKVVVRAYNTRNSWIQLPSENSVFDARFLEPELGTCWEVLVKPDVMHEVRKLTKQKNTPKGDAATGSHSILGSPEGHQDSETGSGTMGQVSVGCLQAATPAQSPHIDAVDLQPSMGLEVEMDHIHNAWLRPSDPVTIVEDLNNIDRLLDEAEQMSQVGYRDDEDSTWEAQQVAAAEDQVAYPEAQQVRRIVVPPEARGLDEEDD